MPLLIPFCRSALHSRNCVQRMQVPEQAAARAGPPHACQLPRFENSRRRRPLTWEPEAYRLHSHKLRSRRCSCGHVSASHGSGGKAAPPKLNFPARFRFCEICANSSGIVQCTVCAGTGTVNTKPGGAGASFYIGTARCKFCSGQGVLPCPLCAGYAGAMPEPDPDRSTAGGEADMEEGFEDTDEDEHCDYGDESWRRFGRVDIRRAGAGW